MSRSSMFYSLLSIFLLYILKANAFAPVSKLSFSIRNSSTLRQAVLSDIGSQPLNIRKKPESQFSLGTCAALVAGTTIGGGFIALPYVTIPVGAKPSVISIFFCWTYLLLSAFSLAQATLGVMKDSKIANSDGDCEHEKISVFRVARHSFGPFAGTVAGGLFVVLMLATLVAQLSKAGSLGAALLPLISVPNMLLASMGVQPESVATVFYAFVMAALTFLNGQVFADRMNMLLTALMVFSFGTMVSLAPSSGWQATGLHRADFSRLLPSFTTSAGPASPTSAWIIPVILQLLVYAEVIPLICTRLRDEEKVRKAILYGSIIPLLMCIIWTVTAIGLVPFGKLSLEIDPVDILMAGTLHTITSSPIDAVTNYLISKAVSVLAFSAVSTTVIGSYLTISVFVEDILSSTKGSKELARRATGLEVVVADSSVGGGERLLSGGMRSSFTDGGLPGMFDYLMFKQIELFNVAVSGLTRWARTHRTAVARLLAILPATLVAGFGSRSLYFAATAFAGSFPVTLLWGLFPPLACLRLAQKREIKLTRFNRNMQLIQIFVSLLMLIANVILTLK